MNQRKIKTALKNAGNAIEKKKYAQAVKLSKSILKCEEGNYNALVFLGISLQELGQNDEALRVFRRAVEVDDSQASAWNELASYYEKDDSDAAIKELIQIYGKLLNLENDTTKFADICMKMIDIAHKLEEVCNTAKVLYAVAGKDDLGKYNRRATWYALACLLFERPNLDPELQLIYSSTLSNVVKDKTSVTFKYYREYLKLLYTKKDYKLLLCEAKRMHKMYTRNVYPLEQICQVFAEQYIEHNVEVVDSMTDIFEYANKLFTLQPNSVLGTFARACCAYRRDEYADARDRLKPVVRMRPELTHAWILLARASAYCHSFTESVDAGLKADELMKSMPVENEILRELLDDTLLASLSRHPRARMWRRAVEIGKKLMSKRGEERATMMSLALAYTNLNKLDEAWALYDKLEAGGHGTDQTVCLLRSEFSIEPPANAN